MKRRSMLLLLFVLAFALLSGCRKTETVPVPVSDAFVPAGTAAPTDTPAPTASPTPTASPVPRETEAPAGTEPLSFPGGLDDDGRGPDETDDPYADYAGGLADDGPGEGAPYPVRSVAMTPEQQKEANLFLSNFAEQYFGDYYETDDEAMISQVVDFAHIWCKINDRSAISYNELDGSVYEVMTLDQVNAVVNRFFPYRIGTFAAESLYSPTEHSFFRDGLFYYLAADGENYNRIAVADAMTLMSDETYFLDFTVYEIDWDTFFGFRDGIPRSYYEMTADQAGQAPELTPVAEGTALTIPHDWKGRASFQLLEYAVRPIPMG